MSIVHDIPACPDDEASALLRTDSVLIGDIPGVVGQFFTFAPCSDETQALVARKLVRLLEKLYLARAATAFVRGVFVLRRDLLGVERARRDASLAVLILSDCGLRGIEWAAGLF